MLRPQACDHPKRHFPGARILTRKPRHQIHVDIRKPGIPCQHKTLLKFRKRVDSSQPFQLLIVNRLTADTDPVEAALPVTFQFFRIQRSRIGLQRNLSIL